VTRQDTSSIWTSVSSTLYKISILLRPGSSSKDDSLASLASIALASSMRVLSNGSYSAEQIALLKKLNVKEVDSITTVNHSIKCAGKLTENLLFIWENYHWLIFH
jgi:hypothetical protein